jgi:chorismate dehydratase
MAGTTRQAGDRLRVGAVSYLNARPLCWGLLRGSLAGRYEVTLCPPSHVAAGLAEGRFDVGLVPSIEVRRQAGLSIVPGLAIAATAEVRSVLLVSRGALSAVRRVALDEFSRTSAALVRLVLAERGLRPEYVQAPADLPRMLETADAALVIGDPALFADRAGVEVMDLAAEWRRMTGLPFVFAVWAVRRRAVGEAALGALQRDLETSFREGWSALATILAEAEAESGLPGDLLERYFTRHLSYRLDAEAEAGLGEFYRRAEASGLVPPADARLTVPA